LVEPLLPTSAKPSTISIFSSAIFSPSSAGTVAQLRTIDLFHPGRRREEAARQQGGLFVRENSSNGGKAIRTFWRNTMVGKMTCQGLNRKTANCPISVVYNRYQIDNMPLHLRHIFAKEGLHNFQRIFE
jgi:hypothetical protein